MDVGHVNFGYRSCEPWTQLPFCTSALTDQIVSLIGSHVKTITLKTVKKLSIKKNSNNVI